MTDEEMREQAALVVRLIRFLRGWSQKRLARAAGVHPKQVYAWEAMQHLPTSASLKRLASAARVPLGAVEYLVPPLLWLQRLARGRAAASARHEGQGDQRRLVGAAQESVAADLVWTLRGLPPPPRWASPPDADEASLGESLVIYLCAKSERSAANDAGRALGLAQAALRVARHAGPAERARLEGYAGHFKGNALRVANELLDSEKAFSGARVQWKAGTVAGTGRLDASRPLDLEASLLCDQSRFSEALELLDQALALCESPEAEGNILLKRALTLEQMGQVTESVATLRQAIRLIDGETRPRQLFGAHFTLAVNLCHLDRFEEAEALLGSIRSLAAQLGNRLDSLRVHWLESRVLAGKGDLEKAVTVLERVQRDFAAGDYFYDAALVTLELARLFLRQGRTDKTKELAARAEPVFRELKVAPRALEAVLVFLEAARQEAATLDLLEQALQALGRGR